MKVLENVWINFTDKGTKEKKSVLLSTFEDVLEFLNARTPEYLEQYWISINPHFKLIPDDEGLSKMADDLAKAVIN